MSPRLASIHHYALLLAICVAAGSMMDALTRPVLIDAPAGGAPVHPGSDRVFVLIVDSFRYETSLDRSTMPKMARLRERSTFAKMITTRDAVTVPALRAAFTGEDRFIIFGFVENLWHREGQHQSIFTDMTDQGRSVCVWSDGSLDQFASDLAERHAIPRGGLGPAAQNRSMEEALDAFVSGRCDVVVAHINYSDRVAHQVGVDDPEYRRVYGIVDDLIASIDERIPDQDTFVMIGDHGHDEIGRHVMGLDVPTVACFRGPGYRPGYDLGTIPIRDTRYLMGWGATVPLPSTYDGGRHPDALVATGEIPPDYARPVDAMVDLAESGAGPPADRRAEYLVAMVLLAALAAVWLRIGAVPVAWWQIAGSWAALVISIVLGWPAAGAALALVAVLWPRRDSVLTWPWLTAVLGAAVGLVGWGVLLAAARPLVHYPPYAVLVAIWAVVLVAGVLSARRFGAMRTAWVLFLIAGGLCYPTVYRYGAPATMVPVLASCLIFAISEDWSLSRRRVLMLTAIAALLLPFAVVNALQFEFDSWCKPIDLFLWGRPKGNQLAVAGIGLALIAKVIFLMPRQSGLAARVVAVAVALALAVAETRWLGSLSRWIVPALAGVCVVAAVTAWRMPSLSDRRHLIRLGAIGALLLVYIDTVRIAPATFLWFDCLAAALVLSGRFLREEVRIRDQATAYPLLLLTGLIVVGWTGLGWTFHRFEWGYLYDWIDAGFVEENAALFLIPIAGRYLIPMVVIRVLLAEVFEGRPYPQRVVNLLAGLKTLSLVLIMWGMAGLLLRSDVFAEAMQQTSLWLLLSTVLFVPIRSRA